MSLGLLALALKKKKRLWTLKCMYIIKWTVLEKLDNVKKKKKSKNVVKILLIQYGIM